MLRTIFILTAFFTVLQARTQTDSIIGNNVICADLDIKGNIYFIDSGYEICKISKGVVANRYSLTNYGEGPVIDASNPLEVFVFYENSGIVLILDNNLNPVQEIHLYASNNLRVLAFGRANDGKIWVYDGNSYTLKKFDRTAGLVAETVILNKGKEQLAGCLRHTETEGVKRVFDNGEYVVFQPSRNNILALNNNLKVVFNQLSKTKLMGLEGMQIMQQDSTNLIESNITTKDKSAKKQLKTGINGEVLCAVKGKILVGRNKKLVIESY